MSGRRQIYTFFTAIALILLSGKPVAQDAGTDENVVNYAYSVVFGTGVYQVEEQKAFVLRLPFSYGVREPSAEHPGMRLLLPTFVGYYDYEKVFEGGLPADAAVLSFVPGLGFEYLVNERWRLKPYGQFGLGRDLSNNENAWIYVGGVSSHYRIPYESKWRFALGNSLVYTGYNPDDGATQSLGMLGVGVDTIYPWGLSLFGRQTNLANYLIYYLYLDNPSFEQGDRSSENIFGEFEWGLALGFEQPAKFLGIEFERIGLGLRYGGDIKGIRLVTTFPF